GGSVEGTHQVQDGGLARAGRPDDPHELATADDQVHAGQRRHATRIRAGHPGQLDHGTAERRTAERRGAGHDGTRTVSPARTPGPLISTWPPANSPVCTATKSLPDASTTSTP